MERTSINSEQPQVEMVLSTFDILSLISFYFCELSFMPVAKLCYFFKTVFEREVCLWFCTDNSKLYSSLRKSPRTSPVHISPLGGIDTLAESHTLHGCSGTKWGRSFFKVDPTGLFFSSKEYAAFKKKIFDTGSYLTPVPLSCICIRSCHKSVLFTQFCSVTVRMDQRCIIYYLLFIYLQSTSWQTSWVSYLGFSVIGQCYTRSKNFMVLLWSF